MGSTDKKPLTLNLYIMDFAWDIVSWGEDDLI